MPRADTNWSAAPSITTWRVGMLNDDGSVDANSLRAAPTFNQLANIFAGEEWEGDPTMDMWAAVPPVPIVLLIAPPSVFVAVPQRTLRVNDTANGTIYDVCIGHDDDGEPYVSSCAVYATKHGQRIDRFPARQLAQYAARHFANEDDEQRPLTHEGRNDDDALRRPTDEEFAAAYIDLRKRGTANVREELAERYDVTVHAIDKRTRKARNAGLIPPARTGRPRTNTKTSAKKKPNTKERKTSK